MRFRVLLLAVALACVAAGPPAPPLRPVNDYAELQGTWQLVAMETRGVRSPIQPQTWTIRRDRLTLKGTDAFQEEMRFTLDLTQRPAWLSFGPNRMGCHDSIIRVQGNTLHVCMSGGGPRPRNFVTAGDGNSFLFIYRRVTGP